MGGGDEAGEGIKNGRKAHCDSYFLDLNTKEWIPGPNITRCRHYHTCSLITNDTSGQREVVVVGGWDEQERGIQEVEIINLDTLQVRNGEENTCKVKFG